MSVNLRCHLTSSGSWLSQGCLIAEVSAPGVSVTVGSVLIGAVASGRVLTPYSVTEVMYAVVRSSPATPTLPRVTSVLFTLAYFAGTRTCPAGARCA